MYQILEILTLLLILCFCSLEDIQCRKVKDRYILVGTAIRIILLICFKKNLSPYLYDGLVVLIFTFLLAMVVVVCERIFKKQLMGGADIKLIFMIGFYVGIDNLLYTLFFSLLLALAVGVILKIKKQNEKIPFVPFLTIAAFLVLLPASIQSNYLACQIVRGL